MNEAQPPTFKGNTSWSMFQRRFETVVEHNQWLHWVADVLPSIPTNTTYEDILQALEDRFSDQHFAAAYRCQLTMTTQKAGESLQDFAMADLLAHYAYPLHEDHIRREAGKVFAYKTTTSKFNCC
jgi:hypothetical protein